MPTYRLLIGIPGKSNAFAISGKLGLPEEIIDDAKQRIDTNDKRFEDVITELNKSRQEIEKEEAAIKERRAEIEKEREALTADNEKLAEQKENLIADAKKEAAKILAEAKELADESIKKFNKWGVAGASASEMEMERTKLRENLDKVQTAPKIAKPKNKNRIGTKPLHIGDMVYVIPMGVKGTVSTLPDDKGNLFVTMGIIRSQVNLSDLAYVEEKTDIKIGTAKSERGNSGATGTALQKSFTMHPEINLIGQTTDEARIDLEKYIDDAYLAHMKEVRVIHGRGTGALRNMVHTYLKKCKYVKSFRDGEYTEGGNGATVVEMKS